MLPFGKKAHWKEDALRMLERITWILSPAAKSDADAAAGDDEDGDFLNDLSDVRVFFLDQFNILLLIHLNESLLQVEDGMLVEDGRRMGESASNRTGDDEREWG